IRPAQADVAVTLVATKKPLPDEQGLYARWLPVAASGPGLLWRPLADLDALRTAAHRAWLGLVHARFAAKPAVGGHARRGFGRSGDRARAAEGGGGLDGNRLGSPGRRLGGRLLLRRAGRAGPGGAALGRRPLGRRPLGRGLPTAGLLCGASLGRGALGGRLLAASPLCRAALGCRLL